MTLNLKLIILKFKILTELNVLNEKPKKNIKIKLLKI